MNQRSGSFGTRTNGLFYRDRSVDILVYIWRHPGCQKSDVYHDVTRNAFTKELMDELGRLGLIDISRDGRSDRLTLTEKGERVVSLLEEVERLIFMH